MSTKKNYFVENYLQCSPVQCPDVVQSVSSFCPPPAASSVQADCNQELPAIKQIEENILQCFVWFTLNFFKSQRQMKVISRIDNF